ncbi:universal stress protein [Micromonospora endolithica]|uniref:Universal stress protein n=1 Tax=Micromonospora endolithica TaxID=230091 RepID=A0A3A9ZC89_9ACTN|nr:universal stress protein [Micromonospora endolithica]RKN46142.1 universal stress protein [Micromonospora endolithica]TWJ25161.1 nucleotide-binding universal stress UspA family protein [Micromonospora endolithica]
MTTIRAPIVVGVDGSDDALPRRPLRRPRGRLATCAPTHRPRFRLTLFHVPLDPPEHGPPEAGLRNQADVIVEHAADTAATAQPGLEVTGVVVTGAPSKMLTAESHTADMIVIGARGPGNFTGLLIGTVAGQTTTHATCSVLIVKGDTDRTGPVIVGVDGSPTNDHAIGFAFGEAFQRAAPRRANYAWQPAGASTTNNTCVMNPASSPTPTPNSSSSAPAARGGFILLGSTSLALLHHAPCPAAIVHHLMP